MKAASAYLALFVIYVESAVQRKSHAKFWENLQKIQNALTENIQNQFQTIHLNKILIKFTIKFIFVNVFFVLIELVQFLFMVKLEKTFIFLAILTTPCLVAQWRLLQAIFYLDLTNFYMKVLVENTNIFGELVESAQRLENTKYDDFLSNKINKMSEFYALLYDLIQSFNEAFGYTGFIIFTRSMTKMATDIYWFIYYIKNEEQIRTSSKCIYRFYIQQFRHEWSSNMYENTQKLQ